MNKLKRTCFLAVLLVFALCPLLVSAAELPHYQKYEGPIKPGVVITKENWEKYLPELQKLLPPSKLKWYGMGVREGLVTMPIVKTPLIRTITQRQMETIRKYAGTARV